MCPVWTLQQIDHWPTGKLNHNVTTNRSYSPNFLTRLRARSMLSFGSFHWWASFKARARSGFFVGSIPPVFAAIWILIPSLSIFRSADSIITVLLSLTWCIVSTSKHPIYFSFLEHFCSFAPLLQIHDKLTVAVLLQRTYPAQPSAINYFFSQMTTWPLQPRLRFQQYNNILVYLFIIFKINLLFFTMPPFLGIGFYYTSCTSMAGCSW